MATEFVTLAWHVRAVTSDDEWGTEKEEAYESDLTWEEKVVEPETENQQTMLQNSTNGLLRFIVTSLLNKFYILGLALSLHFHHSYALLKMILSFIGH